MPKVSDWVVVNTGPVPREVKSLRKEVYDFHLKLGRPIIYKHRWNLDDVQNGLATVCPNLDTSYHRSKTSCPICFGTGFTGGFADGVIQFVTIADTPVDQLKIDPQGYILFDKHPEMTAPWFPLMGDGDLIIVADFDHANWTVLSTNDRFELNEVRPTTIRGPYTNYTGFQPFKIQQTAKLDRIPNNHVYYNVPVEFDYHSTPFVFPPVGSDPDDFPTSQVSISYGYRMNGMESKLSASTSITFKINGGGTTRSAIYGFKLNGGPQPTVVVFE